MTILAADGFSLAFRRYTGLVAQARLPVLEGLNFGVSRGEVLAVIGASGAGKSLLAHAIFGILPDNAVSSGRLLFDGATLDDAARRRLCGRRMALVPQSISHLDPMARCGTQLRWAALRAGGDGSDSSPRSAATI